MLIAGLSIISCKDKSQTGTKYDASETKNTTTESTVYRNPLTGEKSSKEESEAVPVAVMFSNIKDAMPQSSISCADVVFESKVEGGITRMCCLFQNKTDLTKIGPVRSCRTYFLLFAKEFQAIYVHFGASEYADDYLKMSDMHALDGMSTCNFYRTDDRVAPHNAYTSWSGIIGSANDKNYPLVCNPGYSSPFTFNTSDDLKPSGKITKCTCFYPGFEYNNPWFEYNEYSKTYMRFQFGEPEIDAENNQQLEFKNILIKYVEPDYYPNNTPNYKINGSGKGLFISDGYASEVTWVKENEKDGPTKYYYSDGNEIKLNKGKTYVALVETTQKITMKEN